MINFLSELKLCFKENGLLETLKIPWILIKSTLKICLYFVLWTLLWSIYNIALSSIVLWAMHEGDNMNQTPALTLGILTFAVTTIGSNCFSLISHITASNSKNSALFISVITGIAMIALVCLHTLMFSPTIIPKLLEKSREVNINLILYLLSTIVGFLFSACPMATLAGNSNAARMTQAFESSQEIHANLHKR